MKLTEHQRGAIAVLARRVAVRAGERWPELGADTADDVVLTQFVWAVATETMLDGLRVDDTADALRRAAQVLGLDPAEVRQVAGWVLAHLDSVIVPGQGKTG